MMLLDRAAGCGVAYFSALGLFLAEILRCWAVGPFRTLCGRGHAAEPSRAISTAIKGEALHIYN